jgi:hypothetical protein
MYEGSKALGQSQLQKYEGRWDFFLANGSSEFQKSSSLLTNNDNSQNINIYFCDILHFLAKLLGNFRYIFAL